MTKLWRENGYFIYVPVDDEIIPDERDLEISDITVEEIINEEQMEPEDYSD